MAIFRDIETYLQKQEVTGTEKIPVSDSLYLTPKQIASSAFIDVQEDGFYVVDSELYIGSRIDTPCEKTTNKVTSLSSSSTDTQYPSAKCVYDIIGNIEILLSAI